jgi:hypothetical protein
MHSHSNEYLIASNTRHEPLNDASRRHMTTEFKESRMNGLDAFCLTNMQRLASLCESQALQARFECFQQLSTTGEVGKFLPLIALGSITNPAHQIFRQSVFVKFLHTSMTQGAHMPSASEHRVEADGLPLQLRRCPDSDCSLVFTHLPDNRLHLVHLRDLFAFPPRSWCGYNNFYDRLPIPLAQLFLFLLAAARC